MANLSKVQAGARGRRRTLDIVYVNYNSARLLLASIESVLAAAPAGLGRIIVVDNASRPEDAAWLDRLPGAVRLIRAEENLGFGKACNRGAREGRGEFLLFLNPDTRVLPETLPGVLEALASRGGDALVGPRQFADEERRFTISPLRGTSLWGEVTDALYHRGWFPETSLRYLRRRARVLLQETPVPTRAVSGAALALGRRVFESLGGFDERFFLYLEDTDLCRRARARGLPVLYLPAVGVIHLIEQSTSTDRPRAEAAIRAGRRTFLAKHHHAATRALQRLARALARRLPARRHRWHEAKPIDPRGGWPRPEAMPADGRWAVELGRSPLFDNCLTAFPDGAGFSMPPALLERLPAGRYFVRTAVATGPRTWAERSLSCFTREAGTGPAGTETHDDEGALPLRLDQHVS